MPILSQFTSPELQHQKSDPKHGSGRCAVVDLTVEDQADLASSSKRTPHTNQRSKPLCEDKVERATGSELRREHADTGSIADVMDAIENVDHVQAYSRRLGLAIPFEFMRDTGIDLDEERKLAGVGKAASQTAPVDHIGAEASVVPEVGDTSRPRPDLGVVRIDVMCCDVRDEIRLEMHRAIAREIGDL